MKQQHRTSTDQCFITAMQYIQLDQSTGLLTVEVCFLHILYIKHCATIKLYTKALEKDTAITDQGYIWALGQTDLTKNVYFVGISWPKRANAARMYSNININLVDNFLGFICKTFAYRIIAIQTIAV